MKRKLENALPIVASAYGSRFGVEVIVSGEVASTDGKTIVIPAISDDYGNMDAIWGYLAHECAHVRFTDFDIVGKKINNLLLKQLANIFEDSRIERLMMATYPGTRQTLDAVAEHMLSEGMYQLPKKSSHPAHVLTAHLLYNLQSNLVGQKCLSSLAEKAEKIFEQVFPSGVQVRIDVFMRKVADLKSTKEAIELAQEVIKMIKEEQKKEKKSADQKNQQQANDQSQQGKGQSSKAGGNGQQKDGKKQPQGDQSQQKDGKKQAQSGKESKQSGKGQKQAGQDGAGANDPEKAAELLQKLLDAGAGDVIKNAHDKLKEQLEQSSRQNTSSSKYNACTKADEVFNDQVQGRSLIDQVRSDSSRIRSQLMGLVQANNRVSTARKRSGRKLNSKSLSRVAAGDTRVFRAKQQKKGINTAVHLTVDLSGSMHGMREQVAREAAMALSIALEGINGVNPGVSYFSGSGSKHGVFEVLRHGERVVQNAGRFTKKARGGTPLAPAVWYAGTQLLRTSEDKKLLIIVTDGAPCDPHACHDVIELCRNSDIDIVGIGINSDAIKHYVENHIVISSVGDLHKTLFALMADKLKAA